MAPLEIPIIDFSGEFTLQRKPTHLVSMSSYNTGFFMQHSTRKI